MSITTFEELHDRVALLIERNAVHRKRGIALQGVSLNTIIEHMSEEEFEVGLAARIYNSPLLLQAAPEHGDIVTELGDLLAIVSHLMHRLKITPRQVFETADLKLTDIFGE